MDDFHQRFRNWQIQQSFVAEERARVAELRQPFKGNAPELLVEIEVTVLKPFFVRGLRVEVGDVVRLPRHDAISLIASGKATLLTTR